MHKEVSPHSGIRQLARGWIILAANPGRLSTILLSVLLTANGSASSVTYTYDALGRLVATSYDNGSHITYTLDAAGNRVSMVQSLDTTAPAAPTGLAGTGTSPTNIHLTWVACADTSGSLVAGYKIYRAGTQIGTSGTASYNDGTVVSSTSYSYTVSCYDNAVPPNVSAQSTPVIVASLDGTPPSVPTGVTGSAASSTTVNLSWVASTDNSGGSGIAGYKIYRAGVQLGTSAATTFTDATTLGTTAYSYTVAAYDHAGNTSAQSTAFPITTPDTIAPPVPGGLTANAPASGTVNLAWTAVTDTGGSGLSGYKIYRAGAQIGTSGTTSYSDTTTLGTTLYTYTVAAYDNAANTSGQSTSTSVTTPDTIAPSVPTGLTATVISATQINLSWNPSTDTGGSGLAGYFVFRNGGGSIGGGSATSLSDTSVGGSTTYTYTVLAYDNATPFVNESAQSAPVSATTPSNLPSLPGVPGPHGKVTTLSWTESWAASIGPVAYYVLSESGDTTGTYTITAPNTSHAQSGGNGLSYSFQVQACTSTNQCTPFTATSTVTICQGGTCP
jgi:YD repeat-containing protein